ncbi:MAG: DnaJ domain-containing protein [Leptolyngbyaceae cyanobacterium RU_5_1]|nr:DnaJ domain-containing protein [Leptolyngbyaceae cyanobacterium RU_5_1]
MNLAECYRLLGLESGAAFEDIKAAYRRLARKYHPDVSSGDQRAKDRFIEVTTAYKVLLNALADSKLDNSPGRTRTVPGRRSDQAPSATPVRDRPSRRAVQIQVNPNLSPLENNLKASAYQQLQQLLRSQRFPRAIALVEGLADRLPCDPEVTQWQAIVYQQWGRQLIRERQFDKARLYLKKALHTDSHNRSLWAEVEKDFREIEQLV